MFSQPGGQWAYSAFRWALKRFWIFLASITSTSYCALSGVQMSPRTNSGISLKPVFLFLCSPKPHLPHEPTPGMVQERADEAACRRVS